CHVLSHLFHCIVHYICLNVYKNTDLSAHMDVGSNETFVLCHLLESADVHVLTNHCNLCCQSFLYSLCAVQCPWLGKKGVNICCCSCQCLCSNICNVVLEFFIFSYEV